MNDDNTFRTVDETIRQQFITDVEAALKKK